MQINDLQPELGSGLPGRWRLRPTLPGSRVTRRAWRLATLAWEIEEKEEKNKKNKKNKNLMQTYKPSFKV